MNYSPPFSLDDLHGPGAEAADAQAAADVEMAERIAATVVLSVAETPDRFSPDDQPDMMLVTADELREKIMRAFEIEWGRQ